LLLPDATSSARRKIAHPLPAAPYPRMCIFTNIGIPFLCRCHLFRVNDLALPPLANRPGYQNF
jgi:hypothetical protein